MSLRRVVVTGLGAVSPLGTGVSVTWKKLLAGESGISKLTADGYKQSPCKVAGSVAMGKAEGQFDREKYLPKSKEREITLATAYAIKASEEALQDAKWLPKKDKPEDQNRTGVCIGMAIIDMDYTAENIHVLRTQGYAKLTPFFLPKIILNMPAGHVSIKFGLKGPNLAATTACTTGLHAVGDAFRFIREGDADVMVCGGTEASITPLCVAAFAKMRALSTKFNDRPECSSRPFDVERDGFVMSEGAGMLVLEELEHAKQRGAKIYAEVLGYGQSGDAHHVSAPDPSGGGAYRCMKAAAWDANIDPSAVSLVQCHATSTHAGDIAEMLAVRRLLGASAPNAWISATKGLTGHLLSGSGSLEAIFAVLSARDGVVPPMPNLQKLDPELSKDGALLPKFPTGNKPHEWAQKRRIAMKNSFGFGGSNAAVIFSNYDA